MEDKEQQINEAEISNENARSKTNGVDEKQEKIHPMRWLFWDRFLKVMSVVGTLVLLLLIVRQIDRMSEQNKAIWYSMRPDIYIMPLGDSDLTKSSQDDIQAKNQYKDSYTLHYVIKNVGKSPAIIDSIITEYIYHQRYVRVRERHFGRFLPQGIESVENMSILLDTLYSSYFAICIKYKWDNIDKSEETFRYHKFYTAKYDGIAWHFYIVKPDTFSVHVNSIADSMKYEYSESGYHPLPEN